MAWSNGYESKIAKWNHMSQHSTSLITLVERESLWINNRLFKDFLLLYLNKNESKLFFSKHIWVLFIKTLHKFMIVMIFQTTSSMIFRPPIPIVIICVQNITRSVYTRIINKGRRRQYAVAGPCCALKYSSFSDDEDWLCYIEAACRLIQEIHCCLIQLQK